MERTYSLKETIEIHETLLPKLQRLVDEYGYGTKLSPLDQTYARELEDLKHDLKWLKTKFDPDLEYGLDILQEYWSDAAKAHAHADWLLELETGKKPGDV